MLQKTDPAIFFPFLKILLKFPVYY
jgi:hypothetical protein